MFKRSINYPQIYQSLTPGKTIVISFLSNNVISSMKCLWRQQIRTTSWSNVHNVHEICLKKKKSYVVMYISIDSTQALVITLSNLTSAMQEF